MPIAQTLFDEKGGMIKKSIPFLIFQKNDYHLKGTPTNSQIFNP
jgi:hypothetical protein